MFTRQTSPPSGLSESCIVLTAPQDVAVVPAAKKEELSSPKRTSLPSRLPSAGSTPSAVSLGLACDSEDQTVSTPASRTIIITAHTAQPWRRFRTLWPKV